MFDLVKDIVFAPLVLVVLALKWRFLLKILYRQPSPLSLIPDPRLAAWSRFWVVKTLASEESAETFVKVNVRYARIGSNHIITNDPTTIQRILGVRSGYTRGPWFDSIQVDPNVPNIVSQRDKEEHRTLRHKFAASYSSRNLRIMGPVIDEQISDWLDRAYIEWLSTPEKLKTFDIGKRLQFLTHFSVLLEFNPLIYCLIKVPLLGLFIVPKSTDSPGVGRIMGGIHQAGERQGDTGSNIRIDMMSAFIENNVPRHQIDAESTIALQHTRADPNNSKLPKVLAFPPIEAKFANQIWGISAETHKILMTNANGDEGDWGLSMESYPALKSALSPGAGLDAMHRAMIQNVAGSLDGLIPAGSARANIKLSEWLRNVVTIATTNSVAEGHKEGSVLIQNRFATSAKNGVAIEDIARYEVGGSISILVNTTPAVFWLVYFLYSEPELLEEIRKEVGAVVGTSTDENGQAVRSLGITNVKTSCPLLLSTSQESLHNRAMGTSVREVMDDTVIDGKWLLKKAAMIQMPSHKNAKRVNPAAFRGFGGGTTLCPGRHFATNEILAVLSMFIMRFDMKPRNGEWVLPKTENTNVAAVLLEPDTDIEVVVEARKRFEDGRWAFGLRDAEMIFAVVHEDRTD
ncbi:hypothetical protein EYC84_008288 [Monilinia fructicola]|uniref:Cytochrome P450 n=1 Tax=Monilinia fructicola TaxID=38448 RepID=A0A5M9JHL3_MONFR|nr:hypothetical protein EYC84_008288 [Monilinia fructicola]